MVYSVNTTPLLDESESENDINDDNEPIHLNDDNKPLFKPPEPADKYFMAFIIFYMLGMVSLLPWNFFVTADDYWMYKFRNVSKNISNYEELMDTKRTPLQASFVSYINVASSLPYLIVIILNTLFSHKVSVNKRILVSLIFMLILFIITLTFVNIDTDTWQDEFFIIIVTTIALLNVCSAVLCGSIFGLVGLFCPLYITAVISGQSLGGIFAAIAQILSLTIGASSKHTAFVYFIIGIITIILTIVSYIILIKSYFFKFHLYEKHLIQNEFDSELVRPRLINRYAIFNKNITYGLSMFIVFVITIAVFPSVTVLIESEGRGHGYPWNDVFFVPTINYLLFNVGDYIGRIVAGHIQKPKKDYVILILSLARFIFIPLLLLCNAQPRHHWKVVFDQDYEYILILLLFALSNGYLTNLITILVPKFMEHHEKELASSLISVYIGFASVIGSFIGLALVRLL